ncbi:MAG: Zn-dependent oxidoreductase [Frankiales bacterium]|nr:Zn-dependent oxidoreductase [Frankiales bacterium]
MRAAQVTEHGEPGAVVRTVDVDEPEVPEGSVLVRVSTASLNFSDVARARGGVATVLAQPPFTLGMDVCGVVEQGPDEWLGQRVVGITNMAMGGLADKAVVPLTGLFAAPEVLTDVEAAAFLLPFHVAHLALHRRAALKAGETVLVLGAASAVGTAFVQLAVAAGANVLGSAGGPEKGKLVLSLGAAAAIDSESDDLFAAVLAQTGGRGADVIVDLVGGDRTESFWTCIAAEGRYLPVGFNDDATGGFTGRALRKVSMGNFSVVGVMLAYAEPNELMKQFGLNMLGSAVGQQVHADLLDVLASGVRPVVGRVIGLDEVGAALDDHAARRTSGRTVVEVTR